MLFVFVFIICVRPLDVHGQTDAFCSHQELQSRARQQSRAGYPKSNYKFHVALGIILTSLLRYRGNKTGES